MHRSLGAALTIVGLLVPAPALADVNVSLTDDALFVGETTHTASTLSVAASATQFTVTATAGAITTGDPDCDALVPMSEVTTPM